MSNSSNVPHDALLLAVYELVHGRPGVVVPTTKVAQHLELSIEAVRCSCNALKHRGELYVAAANQVGLSPRGLALATTLVGSQARSDQSFGG